MQSRRTFIRTGVVGTLFTGLGSIPLDLLAAANIRKLTVLHTNDVHSRIDPFPMDGGRNQGLGGVVARAEQIKKIREVESNVMLLDAGDIFQGTPYFNLYGGELEMKAMSKMGYDAATIGNHDFDAGLDGLANQLPHATFPMLSANYRFENTLLHGKIQQYQVFDKGGIKVGVFGLGIELDGLVPANLYGETIYENPIISANKIAEKLKFEYHCNIVICLSHLGYKYQSGKVSDVILAEQTKHIDLIIGGHTHTFLNEPKDYKNNEGKQVIINQVGWGGIYLGRIDFYFEKAKRKSVKNEPVIIQENKSE